MILLVVSLGAGSVVLLTGLGEGARLFVAGEFSALGTDTLTVLPGRQDTTGGMPPIMGTAPRDITLDDAEALRQLPGIVAVAPIVIGASTVSVAALQRDGIVIGTTADYFRIRNMEPVRGSTFPERAASELPPVALLGPTMARELFPGSDPTGAWLRIGDRRFRVVGVLGETRSFGMDLGDAVFVPVNHAQQLYDANGMFRVIAQVDSGVSRTRVASRMKELLQARHDGEEDVTITSPDAMLKSLDAILGIMTIAVAGIAGISLLVAGILIMNVTLIAVTQRTAEIGLLKALGAPAGTVRSIFLTEALLMTLAGGIAGVLAGEALLLAGRHLWPSIPFAAPWASVLAALLVSLLAGLVFALVPANRAARLDPVLALAGKK